MAEVKIMTLKDIEARMSELHVEIQEQHLFISRIKGDLSFDSDDVLEAESELMLLTDEFDTLDRLRYRQ